MLITSSDIGWGYGEDSIERSFINLENGTEKLIISLDIKNRPNDAVLVIPLPAAPDTIKADVLSETPQFYGYNVPSQARQKLSNIRNVLLSTQIYPIIPLFIYEKINIRYDTNNWKSAVSALGAIPGGITQDIVVYQHLEKEGMIAEVLSATNSDSLYNYLTQKGLKVEKDSIPIFKDYINKDFSFVVSWIKPATSYISARGLYMTFPAEKIYYPLKPNSAYSGNGTTKTITVIGHVTPELYSDIKNSTKVDYLYSENGSAFKDFFSSNEGFGFTQVTTNANPQKFTQDLYISQNTPLKILNAQFINLYPFLYGLIMLIVLSFISTHLACRFLLRLTSLTSIDIFKLSLLNWLTLMGTIIGSFILLRKKNDRINFVITFSLTFVVFTLASWLLISYLYR